MRELMGEYRKLEAEPGFALALVGKVSSVQANTGK